ncbi:hypothetical protein C8Q73DRAFT_191165 [Cubamyces lactineus]|nr:hypothetical protein C8Q73DRAFT_191165 [Cubamyces lactineus]
MNTMFTGLCLAQVLVLIVVIAENAAAASPSPTSPPPCLNTCVPESVIDVNCTTMSVYLPECMCTNTNTNMASDSGTTGICIGLSCWNSDLPDPRFFFDGCVAEVLPGSIAGMFSPYYIRRFPLASRGSNRCPSLSVLVVASYTRCDVPWAVAGRCPACAKLSESERRFSTCSDPFCRSGATPSTTPPTRMTLSTTSISRSSSAALTATTTALWGSSNGNLSSESGSLGQTASTGKAPGPDSQDKGTVTGSATPAVAPPTAATVEATSTSAKQGPAAAGAATFPKTTIFALAASLGASASCAIVLLGLCWRRRTRRGMERHNVVPADPGLRESVCPEGSRHEDRHQCDNAFCGSDSREREGGESSRIGLPTVTRIGPTLEGAGTGRRGCKLVHRASALSGTVRNDAVRQETPTVATQGSIGPRADCEGAGGPESVPPSWSQETLGAVAAGAQAGASARVEMESRSSGSAAPTYTSEEPILPWTRDALSRREWVGSLACSESASDEAPPPYEPRRT